MAGNRLFSSVVPVTAACALLLWLQGCESLDQAVAQTKTATSAALASLTAMPTQGGNPGAPGIAGSELDGVFKRYPLGNSTVGAYPRAAITITTATPSILKPGQATSDQCIRFKVRLWSNATTSKLFDGLQMCAGDKSLGVPFRTLLYWQNHYPAGEDTTGAVRTDGPRRPKTNFPTDPKTAFAWFDTPGVFFLGSVLYQMGFDWDQPGETRAWFVSAPSS